MLQLAHNKIDFLFDELTLTKIMEKDTKFLKQIQEPEYIIYDRGQEEDEYYIVDMVRMNYTQVVKVMIGLNAKLDVESKKRIDYSNGEISDDPGTKIFKIAYKVGDK